MFNFYSSVLPEYYWQKSHYNLGNKIVHSSIYKSLIPIRAKFDYKPNQPTQMPFFLGTVPQFTWVYGNLDYSYNKYHRHYQAHDDWYPDRKNKSLGFKQGGYCQPTGIHTKYMTLVPDYIPRGCNKEIRKYQQCLSGNSDKESCFNDKLSIMEVCPDHVLEGLKEKKKWYQRAKAIDNQTYKRAMTVSSYNKGRSVSDVKQGTWADGTYSALRSDTYWRDDRYDPTKYPHPHRYDNINVPKQEYKDIFGGTWGDRERREQEKYKPSLFTGRTQADNDEMEAKKRMQRSMEEKKTTEESTLQKATEKATSNIPKDTHKQP